MASSTIATPSHPYYPLDVKIIGYLANDRDILTLLSMFSTACVVVISSTYLVVTKVRPQISTGDLWTVVWFVICGCIHTFMEGYYCYNFRSMGSRQDVLGQMWKLYSLADSRYQSQDAFVLCIETITVTCWGPLCFFVATLTTTNNPFRHPFQIMISLAHLYGAILYYATNIFNDYINNISYSRPEPAIFWGLYVFMNSFWVIFPSLLLSTSIRACGNAFMVAAKIEKKGEKSAVE